MNARVSTPEKRRQLQYAKTETGANYNMYLYFVSARSYIILIIYVMLTGLE